MKTNPIQSLSLLLLATLTACGSSDLPIQHADNYGDITFSAQPERLATRTNPYEAYSPAKHPSTMGVFGYYDETGTVPDNTNTTYGTIFDNTKATYNASQQSWLYSPIRRWDDYRKYKTFDFFASMPYSDKAKLTQLTSEESGTSGSSGTDGTTYTLSTPYDPTSPLLYDVTQAPIICATPVHRQGTDASGNELTFERIINFRFDQTLTAYRLLFKLDAKMNAIRYFRITKVELYGTVPEKGIISRSYTWDKNGNKDWTAGNIQWKDIGRKEYSIEEPIVITHKSSDVNGNESSDLIVTSADYEQWGKTFYTIPDSKFNPTIRVTYDVEFKDKDGETIVTRKDVESEIELNKTNFKQLKEGGIAMVNSIRILIQPRYLYVLADEDAYTGHLLIE